MFVGIGVDDIFVRFAWQPEAGEQGDTPRSGAPNRNVSALLLESRYSPAQLFPPPVKFLPKPVCSPYDGIPIVRETKTA